MRFVDVTPDNVRWFAKSLRLLFGEKLFVVAYVRQNDQQIVIEWQKLNPRKPGIGYLMVESDDSQVLVSLSGMRWTIPDRILIWNHRLAISCIVDVGRGNPVLMSFRLVTKRLTSEQAMLWDRARQRQSHKDPKPIDEEE